MRAVARLILGGLIGLSVSGAACTRAAPPPARDTAGAPVAQSAGGAAQGAAPTRVIVAGTTSIESTNPYVDRLFGLWCDVLGCLLRYDFARADYAPDLAVRWEPEGPTTWVFHLRPEARWSDGTPLTAADVVHSFERARNDPASRQGVNVAPIERAEAADAHTVRITTKQPTASLPSYLMTVPITSKAQYEQHGDAVWRERPLGAGPYRFHELVPDRHVVVRKSADWWGGRVEGPDEVVLRVMREPEVRVTALLNGEIQVALNVPPHMAERVASSGRAKAVAVPAAEMVILGMNVRMAPWDNRLLRQAVGYAIDREAIIAGVLQGQARRLDGPIGPGQVGYDANLQPRYPYDPERARQLVAQAGYPNGVDVELASPVGRYPQDKQVVEAIAPMLTAVGIRTRVLTPEWPSLFADINAGKVPFYYMSRTSVIDPGVPLAQYFETGGSRRTGYSDARVDALFARERAAFDAGERKAVLGELMSLITEEAPAQFLFQQTMIRGVARNVEFEARPDEDIVVRTIRVR